MKVAVKAEVRAVVHVRRNTLGTPFHAPRLLRVHARAAHTTCTIHWYATA